jgi:hypothetical protein
VHFCGSLSLDLSVRISAKAEMPRQNINAPRSEANVYIQIQRTENEHPKPDKRAGVAATELYIYIYTNGDHEAREGASVLACVHYRTARENASSRPKRAYQNYRKMVEICTLLPGFVYAAL